MYRGGKAQSPDDAAADAEVSRQLDALIAAERKYTPADMATALAHPRLHKFAFRTEENTNLTLSSRRRACSAMENDLGTPMDTRRNVLFIIGTQKGGTTYLFNALKKNPSFVGADHAYGSALTCLPAFWLPERASVTLCVTTAPVWQLHCG